MDFGGIFNLTTDSVIDAKETTSSDPNQYRLSVTDEKCVNKTYVTTGRFVPDVNADPKVLPPRHKIKKAMYYVPSPDDPTRYIYIDAPNNVTGKNDFPTTAYMKNAYDKSRNFDPMTPPALIERLKVLRRSVYHFALFLIYDDPQHPEYNGKIKVLRFGKYINDMIENIAKPDKATKRQEVNPFDPINGKDITIIVSEDKASGMPTYVKSAFQDGTSGISIDGGVTHMSANATIEERTAVFNFLKENSPLLKDYESKPESLRADEATLIEVVRQAYGEQFYEQFCQVYLEHYRIPYQPTHNNVTAVDVAIQRQDHVTPVKRVVAQKIDDEHTQKKTAPKMFKSLRDDVSGMNTDSSRSPIAAQTAQTTIDVDDPDDIQKEHSTEKNPTIPTADDYSTGIDYSTIPDDI